LRDGVTFHNGKPADADALVANWTFFKKSNTTSGAFGLIKDFHALPAEAGTKTPGPLKMVVNTDRPWTSLPEALATQIGVLAYPEWLESTDGRKPIGTGPFILSEWVQNNHLIVKRNRNYWGRDELGNQLPFLEQIVFRPVPQELDRANGFKADDFQITTLGEPATIAEFAESAKQGEIQIFDKVSGETQEAMIQLNGESPVFAYDREHPAPGDGLEARQALAYATDKQALVDALYGGAFEVSNGPYLPSSRWYTDVRSIYPQYDLTKARELAAKVKARMKGRFEFTVLNQANNPAMADAVQKLQAQWEEAGIYAKIVSLDAETIAIAALLGRSGDPTAPYDAAFWYQFDAPTPTGDSVWWSPKNAEAVGDISLNFAHNRDERMEDVLNDALGTADPARYKADYDQIQRFLAEDVPYVWLFHTRRTIAAADNLVNVLSYTLPPDENGQRVKGIPLVQGFHPLSQVWIRQS
jgi:peptide/nickel transport system substrate-binding protein